MITPKKSYLIVLLIFILSAGLSSQLKISNVPGSYVPKDLPSYQLSKEAEKIFNNDETLIFVFELSESLKVDEVTRLANFVNELYELENVHEVFSVFDYEHIRGNSEGFEVSNILSRKKTDLFDKKIVSEKIKKDRFLKDILVNKEMNIFSIIIEPKKISDSFERFHLENKIFKLIEKNNLLSLQKAYGGDFAIDMMQFRELINLIFKIVPLVLFVGMILIFFMFPNMPSVLLAFMVTLLGSQFTVGLVSLFQFDYNMITSVVSTLIMALTTAFIIHLYNAILRINQEKDIQKSIDEAVFEVKKPLFFSALTTSIGLFSLGFSRIPPLSGVGIVCGIGIFFSWAIIIYILPILLKRFSHKNWKKITGLNSFLDKIIEICLKIVLNHYRKIVLVFIGVFLISISQVFKVKSETNLYKFFSDDHYINKSMDYIKSHFVGVTNITAIFTAKGKNESLLMPEFHKYIEKAKEEILKIEDVDRVFSATDIVKQINWAFHNEKEEFFAPPESKELLEQYLFVYDGNDLFDNWDRTNQHMKMMINLRKDGANEVEGIFEKVKDILERKPKSLNFDIGYSGYGKVFADQEDLVLEDFSKSLYLSSILIFVVMIFIWRSVKDSIYCMIPNFSPVLSMFIIMGIFGIWLDIGTAMIASITLGIAVDDTIHIFYGIKEKMKLGTLENAISQTFRDSGKAIIMTTVILSFQFLILVISEFHPLQYFGLLTSIGLIIALFFDLLFLPSFILIMYRNK